MNSRPAGAVAFFQGGLLIASSLLAFAASGVAVAAQDDELTQGERRSLAEGELVSRPLRKRAGSPDLIGGASWQVIDATPLVVWRAIHDVERYPKMVPGVIEARTKDVMNGQRSVFIRQGVWPVIGTYNVLMNSEPNRWTLTFELDRRYPHDIVAGWGSIRLTAYGNRTLMTFAVVADLGHGALKWAARPLVQKWALRLPATVKAFVEDGGRKLYAAP
jgi:hypothetical protein